MDGSTDRFPKGFRENIKADLEDFFENPTFAQAMPVLRAQMLSMNYDGALTRLEKKFADRIGKDISVDEIQHAARMAAYAKNAAGKPKKKSNFAKRLEEMQKQAEAMQKQREKQQNRR
jgi:hypothetical protein